MDISSAKQMEMMFRKSHAYGGKIMTLAKTSIEMLVDLVEIKMLSMEVRDLEDKQVMSALTQCRSELISMAGKPAGSGWCRCPTTSRRSLRKKIPYPAPNRAGLVRLHPVRPGLTINLPPPAHGVFSRPQRQSNVVAIA